MPPASKGSPTRGVRAAGSARGTKGRGAAAVAERAKILLKRLRREYPDAHTELAHQGAFQLLVATILSAQTTDVGVNRVTPVLFTRYPTAAALAAADPPELERIIKSTGFFRSKARSLIGMASALVDRFQGAVPETMEALVTLPGVGRKTANVVLGNAFGVNVGIVVDTHVARLSQRLGLTRQTDAARIEQDLMPLIPRRDWTLFAHLLIFHGRRVCVARKPRCDACVLNDVCPSAYRV